MINTNNNNNNIKVPAFIEVSQFSRMKYEWDEENHMLKLDRVLSSAVFYPVFFYGLIWIFDVMI